MIFIFLVFIIATNSAINVQHIVNATEEIVGISLVWVPDSSVEFKIFGELFRCGLGSFEIYSMKNTSESIESIEILEVIFKL